MGHFVCPIYLCKNVSTLQLSGTHLFLRAFGPNQVEVQGYNSFIAISGAFVKSFFSLFFFFWKRHILFLSRIPSSGIVIHRGYALKIKSSRSAIRSNQFVKLQKYLEPKCIRGAQLKLGYKGGECFLAFIKKEKAPVKFFKL